MPTPQQLENEYPPQAYHLGFFAAITVEGDNIVLDLNGKSIRQSEIFNLQQRFYAHIELASTPFIPGQGPANFGSPLRPARKCFVGNGYLGLSSHHGIHGNGMTQIMIQNLNIFEYEVAGIALNGGIDNLVRNVQICNMSREVKVLSTYSARRFIRSFLTDIYNDDPNAKIFGKNGQQLRLELETEMNKVKDALINREPIPEGIYKNKSGLYDGGGYGIVLNSRGVVVNGFKKNRVGAEGNVRNIVHNVYVDKSAVGKGEIIGICACHEDPSNPSYGGMTLVGPVGNVLRIKEITTDGKYVGDILSNAKMFVAKFGNKEKGTLGTTNIPDFIIEWAENNTELDPIMVEKKLSYISGGDSMGHIMKGYIQFFISAGKDIKLFDNTGTNARNEGPPGAVNESKTNTNPGVIPLEYVYNGNAVRGLAITGSENISIKNMKISTLESLCGVGYGVDVLNQSKDIESKDLSITTENIVSTSQYNVRAAPNPQTFPRFVEISKESNNVLI